MTGFNAAELLKRADAIGLSVTYYCNPRQAEFAENSDLQPSRIDVGFDIQGVDCDAWTELMWELNPYKGAFRQNRPLLVAQLLRDAHFERRAGVS